MWRILDPQQNMTCTGLTNVWRILDPQQNMTQVHTSIRRVGAGAAPMRRPCVL